MDLEDDAAVAIVVLGMCLMWVLGLATGYAIGIGG